MMFQERKGKLRRVCAAVAAGWLLLAGAPAAWAETLRILSWNILSYDSPNSAEYQALVRVVQAVNPDVILFQEATNTPGRDAFAVQFAFRYPYQFTGFPVFDLPKNQILSSYPLTATGQIFTPDPSGGLFQRPTVWADVDVHPAHAGAELRVYSAHFKSGSEARDTILRLNQATDDAAHVAALVAERPGVAVYYAGDLNAETGELPLAILQDPQTTLIRLPIINPYDGDDQTRWPSGRTIDHIFYSATLSGRFLGSYIFHSEVMPAELLPPPALSTDSHTASDHLALVATINVPEPIIGHRPDFDRDGDVDSIDRNFLLNCLAGAGQAPPAGCAEADIDGDGDVDQSDFGVLQRCISGANLPAAPECRY